MCPNGYSTFNENCYGAPGSDVMNWEEARVACEELTQTFSSYHLTFDLVSILSTDENVFVFSNVTHGEYSIFLGLRRKAYESDFQWSDKSEFLYESWGGTYPSYNVNRNCT